MKRSEALWLGIYVFRVSVFCTALCSIHVRLNGSQMLLAGCVFESPASQSQNVFVVRVQGWEVRPLRQKFWRARKCGFRTIGNFLFSRETPFAPCFPAMDITTGHKIAKFFFRADCTHTDSGLFSLLSGTSAQQKTPSDWHPKASLHKHKAREC